MVVSYLRESFKQQRLSEELAPRNASLAPVGRRGEREGTVSTSQVGGG